MGPSFFSFFQKTWTLTLPEYPRGGQKKASQNIKYPLRTNLPVIFMHFVKFNKILCNNNDSKVKTTQIINYQIICSFLSFFCSFFQALMQWTHFPPFLKWGHTTYGYLLVFDKWLKSSAEETTDDWFIASYNYFFNPIFYSVKVSISSAVASASNFMFFNKMVNSPIYLSLRLILFWRSDCTCCWLWLSDLKVRQSLFIL